jgi:MFS family permease
MHDTVKTAASEEVAAAAPGAPSAAVRWYCLVVLMLVTAVSMLDRQIMSILVEPIRRDLGLNDSQMGLLSGVAFALVYATLCLPAARLADRWRRKRMIAIALTIWSTMTMLCGAAANGVQMFLTRFGVGAGEACGGPAVQALVGDMFPMRQRATAMTVLVLASPLGITVGLAAGGWALQEFGWRTVFLLAGIPGFILAPLVLFTFPNIQKGMADGARAAPVKGGFLTTVGVLWRTRAYVNMVAGAALMMLLSLGAHTWLPAFLQRSHGLSYKEIGAGLGAAFGVGSLIGHLAGGPLMDLLGRRDLRWHFWMAAIIAPLGALCAASAFLAPAHLVFPLIGAQALLVGLFAAPLAAITMNLAPVEARATGSAIMTFVIQGIGVALGPQVVGLLSDALRPSFGEESLRVALLAACIVGVPATWFFFRASLTYRKDVAAVLARNQAA